MSHHHLYTRPATILRIRLLGIRRRTIPHQRRVRTRTHIPARKRNPHRWIWTFIRGSRWIRLSCSVMRIRMGAQLCEGHYRYLKMLGIMSLYYLYKYYVGDTFCNVCDMCMYILMD